MTAQRQTNKKGKDLSRDLDRLMARAMGRPGIAELLALNNRYQSKLAEINRWLRRGGVSAITTRDSTA
ncbi:MAG: hypothetical protein ACT4P6_10385 [Gemmatimonadaceae bacterium]